MGLGNYLAHKAGWIAHGFDAPWNHEDFSLARIASKTVVTATAVTALFWGYSNSQLRWADNGFDRLRSLDEPSHPYKDDSRIYSTPDREFSGWSPYTISTPLEKDSGSIVGNSPLFGTNGLDRMAKSL